jgi:FHS family L-fucose permease-like MFS transporter
MYATIDPDICYALYLTAIWVLFAGLSILETACNSYIFAMGPESTGTQRLNFAQSFNPLGSISGVVISQVFVLSNLSHLTASDRALLSTEDLSAVQSQELNAVSSVYIAVGLVMLFILLLIAFTKMPAMHEGDKVIDIRGTFKRLFRKRKYVWGVIAQFFYVGAQIAVWSYIIRYVMQALKLDAIIGGLGPDPSDAAVIGALRDIDPLASGFYNLFEFIGMDALLPRTAEQAGATYYIMSLILFVAMRFVCTGLMKYFQPRTILSTLAVLAVTFCFGTIYIEGIVGVYSLVGISACMSLMFPTIYGQTIHGLGNDTKMGGAGLVMTIAGGAVLTQLMGIMSGMVNNQIQYTFWIPLIAFVIVAFYSIKILRPISKANN